MIEFFTRSIREADAELLETMGTVAGNVGQFVERKAAEEELRRSERELSDFFENATVGLHWVGPDGTILRANRTELDMLGYGREEYVGRRIADFHADEDVICDILGRLQAGERLTEYPARLRCKDGSIKDVLIDSSVLWRDGQFVHTRCFTRDVTERRRAEEALRAAKEEAEAANQAKTQFLAVLSHELRTPLNPILLAASSMLERPPEPQEIRPTLEMIRQNVNLQARLIDDLLDVMRIVRGKMPLHWEVADGHRLIDQAVQVCRSEVLGKRLRLEAGLAAAHRHVNADPARLQQVFWNLIKNAVKFTPEGGSIAVRTRNESAGGEDRLVVEVSDTGIGIEPDDPADDLRPVPAGGDDDHPQVRRAGAGPGHLQGDRRGPRRHDRRRERRAGPGDDLPGGPQGAARAGGRSGRRAGRRPRGRRAGPAHVAAHPRRRGRAGHAAADGEAAAGPRA